MGLKMYGGSNPQDDENLNETLRRAAESANIPEDVMQEARQVSEKINQLAALYSKGTKNQDLDAIRQFSDEIERIIKGDLKYAIKIFGTTFGAVALIRDLEEEINKSDDDDDNSSPFS